MEKQEGEKAEKQEGEKVEKQESEKVGRWEEVGSGTRRRSAGSRTMPRRLMRNLDLTNDKARIIFNEWIGFHQFLLEIDEDKKIS